MYVCICNAITEKDIHAAAHGGARNLWDLQASLGVASGCGTCRETAMQVLRDAHGCGEPKVYHPSAA